MKTTDGVITHAVRWGETAREWGVTRCGIWFSEERRPAWAQVVVVTAPTSLDIDCMACIARGEPQ